MVHHLHIHCYHHLKLLFSVAVPSRAFNWRSLVRTPWRWYGSSASISSSFPPFRFDSSRLKRCIFSCQHSQNGVDTMGFLILSTSDLLSLGGSQKITRYATGRTKHHSFAASPHHHILILANEKAVGSAARERQDNSRTNNQHNMLPLPLYSGKIFEGAHESSSGGQYQENLHGDTATYWPARPCPGLGRQKEGIYI